MRVVPFVCASLCLLAVSGGSAQLDEERLRLMRETSSYMDVIDAFDAQDAFDLNVQLEFARQRAQGTVYREGTSPEGVATSSKVAANRRDVSQLTLELDVGLYRDLMAFVRLPLVLSDTRSLRLPAGAEAAPAQAALAEVSGPGLEQPLFELPAVAATRAGLDYVAFGGAWAVLNQNRRSWLPNWVLRIEGRRALGTPLHACVARAEGTRCGTASGEDRDGDGQPDGTRAEGGGPGASRGVSGLLFETRFSRRYRRAEPFAGLAFLLEWPSTARRAFLPARRTLAGDSLGRARPGPESSATLGVALIPWEHRGTFQRVLLDLRVLGAHVARGTDYSPLFDALGSSNHPELARARYEGARGSVGAGSAVPPCAEDGASACGVGERVPFYGLTEIAPHLRYGGQLGIEVQAARYVRFALASSLQWVTAHRLSGREPCSGDSSLSPYAGSDDGRVCAEGRVDPRYRGILDAPGHRFELRDQLLLGVYAQATAMF